MIDALHGRSIVIDWQAVMKAITISPKFQIVIPPEVREALKLESGQELQVLIIDGRIELVPIRPMKALRGFLKGIDTRVDRDGDRV